MQEQNFKSAFILGFFVFLGLAFLGYFIGSSAIKFKLLERTVTVKGLAEREYPADIALWPIQFTRASNNLNELYAGLEQDTSHVIEFLKENGISDDEINMSTPLITDKLAQQYGGSPGVEFRFTASRTVTVYSKNVDLVRSTMTRLVDLGKKGITLSGDEYRTTTEYIYTKLNDVKPEMIEEATTKAREVAEKFTHDSNSKLGKIKTAQQGQFSIEDRDKNTPYIKKVRVVSTIEYYLTD